MMLTVFFLKMRDRNDARCFFEMWDRNDARCFLLI